MLMKSPMFPNGAFWASVGEGFIYRFSFGYQNHKEHSTIKLRLFVKKTFAKRRNHVRQTFGNIGRDSGDTLVQSHWCAECHHWEQGKELWSPSVPVSTVIRIFKSANTKSIPANDEMTQMRQAASESLTPLCPSACLYHINLLCARFMQILLLSLLFLEGITQRES